MDFNKAIEFATSSSAYINLNTITAAPTVGTPFSGYVVESISYANASIGGFTGPLAQRDGLEADIALIGPRQVQLVVQVYGSSEADLYDKLNDISSAMAPYPSFASSVDGFRDLRFSQSTISNTAYSSTGVIPLRMRLRPTSIPNYNLSNDLVTARTSDRGVSTKAAITLLAKDPRKLAQTATTGSISVSASTTSSTTVTNPGNYNAYPVLTIVNASASSQTATISSSLWTSVVVLPASSTVTLDSEDRFAKIGTTLRMDLVSGTSTGFPYLVSGDNTITVSALTSVTITYSFFGAWL
jgi:hypothetical protein